MTNLLLAAILLCLACGGLAAFFVYRRLKAAAAYYESEIREYIGQIEAFVSPAGDGKPSPLAQSAEVLSEMLARSLMAQVKTTLMGMRSGEVRGQRAEAGEQAVETAQGLLPGLAALPGVRSTLKKNPGLLDLALQVLGPKLFGGGGQSSEPAASGNGNGHVRFKL